MSNNHIAPSARIEDFLVRGVNVYSLVNDSRLDFFDVFRRTISLPKVRNICSNWTIDQPPEVDQVVGVDEHGNDIIETWYNPCYYDQGVGTGLQ